MLYNMSLNNNIGKFENIAAIILTWYLCNRVYLTHRNLGKVEFYYRLAL